MSLHEEWLASQEAQFSIYPYEGVHEYPTPLHFVARVHGGQK